MHDELVKRLRTAQRQACLVAEETAKMPNTIFGEAADAIDELNHLVDRLEDLIKTHLKDFVTIGIDVEGGCMLGRQDNVSEMDGGRE